MDPYGGGEILFNGSVPCSYPDEHVVNRGTTVSLEAVPAEGYKFLGWEGDAIGTENPITVEVNIATYITAKFTDVMHSMNVRVAGNGATSIVAGDYLYPDGDKITIVANPASGWRFESWSGDVSSPYSASTSVVIDSDKTITANFTPIMDTLTIRTDGSGTTTPEAGDSYSYAEGTAIEITATPENGWQFDGWSGEVSDPTSATTTVVLGSDETVTANFSRIMHEITIKANGNGTTDPSPYIYSYAEGTIFTLIATPENGWQFDSWSGDVSNAQSATTTVTVAGDMTITGNFSKSKHTAMIIGIIAGAVGAGLGTYFATRRKKPEKKTAEK